MIGNVFYLMVFVLTLSFNEVFCSGTTSLVSMFYEKIMRSFTPEFYRLLQEACPAVSA